MIDYNKIANSVIEKYDFGTGPNVSNIGTIDDFIMDALIKEYGSESISRDTIVGICNDIRAEIIKIQTN